MITYKYIENYFKDDSDSEEFCKKHNIVYFKPTRERKAWLKKWLKDVKLPKIECKRDITCYWRDFGTWGMYHPEDNSISICPYEIERAGGLEQVILHEIVHLEHPELDKLPHNQKEDKINGLGNKPKKDKA